MSDSKPLSMNPPQELIDAMSRAAEQARRTKEMIDTLERGGMDVSTLKSSFEAVQKWADQFSDAIGKIGK